MDLGKPFGVGTLVGAAATLAVVSVVSVYEGHVRMANLHGAVELSAGQRAIATLERAPTAGTMSPAQLGAVAPSASSVKPSTSALEMAPPATATREELLARDTAQRGELARLRQRLVAVEEAAHAAPQQGRGGGPHPEDIYKPTQQQLAQMATECRLGWDMPPLGLTPQLLDEKRARERGLTDGERQNFNQVLTQLNQRVLAQLRALYVETTGDTGGAGTLDPHALTEEIESKNNPDDVQAAYKRLAMERAGQAAPPSDTTGEPTVERMLRLLTSLGDAFEKQLGEALGPDRAKSLREEHQGWGSKVMSSHGCPGEK